VTISTDDETAIRALVHRYTTAIADRDADAWSATWMEDGVWDVGGGATEGQHAIRAAWIAAMERFVDVGHVATFAELTIDGNTATGRWVVDEDTADASGQKFAFTADYHDRYARTADGWRFAERRLVFRP
jgi:uncharacterized protein (TIGR02246 family)